MPQTSGFWRYDLYFSLCIRLQMSTRETTVRWRTDWSSHPRQRDRTVSSLRPTRASSRALSCSETCAGPTSSLRSSPRTTTDRGWAAEPMWWWINFSDPVCIQQYWVQHYYSSNSDHLTANLTVWEMKFFLIPLAKQNECLALAEVKSLNNLNHITLMLWSEGISQKGCLVWLSLYACAFQNV